MQAQTRTFRAHDVLWQAVTAAAAAEGITTSEIVRRALLAYVPVKAGSERSDAFLELHGMEVLHAGIDLT